MKLKIAIIGAGIMGSDIALDLASNGYKVILKDLNQDLLLKSKEKIIENFRTVKMFKSNIIVDNIEDVLENITFTHDYDCFHELDFVIENIAENWDLKKELYLELNDICPNGTIYAVNTSCISITKISSLLLHPDKAIGVHFMNPVPLKKMVEVVKGYHTSPDTIDTTKEFLKSIKKTPVVVNDFPGFVANRLSHLFMNEAAFLVQDQVAGPKEIDAIFKLGYGHAMGPLETADLIGLDTVVDSLNVLYTEYQDSKFRCCPLLKKKVAAGLLGKKSGEGFYKY